VELGELSSGLEQFAAVTSLSEAQPHCQATAFAGQDPTGTSECYAARALWALGYPDRAMVRVSRARTLAHPRSPAETRVLATYFLAHLHQLRGEAHSAQEHAESAMALADDYGLSVWVALARMIRGWARVEQGAREEGIDEIRRGLSAYEATGARLWRAQWLGVLAQSLEVSGFHDEAMDAVVDGLNLVRETGEDGSTGELLRIEGELLLAHAGEEGLAIVKAEKSLTRALTIARSQQARSWELRAATSLARLYCHQGKPIEAVHLVKPVFDWFTEGRDTMDIRAAWAFLSQPV
jgi:predicted ATPase